MMKRSLLLPAAVALSAHAWLLFGFTPGRRPALVIAPPDAPRELVQIVVEEEPPPPELVAPGGAPTARSLPPMQPDTPALTTVENAITMPLNPAPARITPDDRLAPGPIDYSGVHAGSGDGIGPGNGLVIDASLLDKEPRTRLQTPPQYPFEMKRNGQGGEVTVAFTVDEAGRVLNPRVLKSSARDFEEPTLRAVEKWRFEPGKRDGRPVRFQMVVPVGFKVTDS